MNKKTMVLLTNYINNKTAHTTGLYFNTNFSKLYHSRLKLVFSTQHSDQLDWNLCFTSHPVL
jgi:hypothetical protein